MYSKCIFSDSSMVACYNSRYLCRLNLQQLDGAVSDLSHVVELNPSPRVRFCRMLLINFRHYNNLGIYRSKLENARKPIKRSSVVSLFTLAMIMLRFKSLFL